MVEINPNVNIQFSANDMKVKREKAVAEPPVSVPKNHLFSDSEANKRINEINQDIYEGRKEHANKTKRHFWIGFGSFVAAVLAYKGIRAIFRK